MCKVVWIFVVVVIFGFFGCFNLDFECGFVGVVVGVFVVEVLGVDLVIGVVVGGVVGVICDSYSNVCN